MAGIKRHTIESGEVGSVIFDQEPTWWIIVGGDFCSGSRWVRRDISASRLQAFYIVAAAKQTGSDRS